MKLLWYLWKILNVFIVGIALILVIYFAIDNEMVLFGKVERYQALIALGGLAALFAFLKSLDDRKYDLWQNNKPLLHVLDFHGKKIPQNSTQRTVKRKKKDYSHIAFCSSDDCSDVHLANLRLKQGTRIKLLEISTNQSREFYYHKNHIKIEDSTFLNQGEDYLIEIGQKKCRFLHEESDSQGRFRIYVKYISNAGIKVNQIYSLWYSKEDNVNKSDLVCGCRVLARVYSYKTNTRYSSIVSRKELIYGLRLSILRSLKIRKKFDDSERLLMF